MQNRVFSFPRMGGYQPFIERAIKNLFPGAEVLPPSPVTRLTTELGSRHSPDDVCAPFKHCLGGFIESLDNGANVLVQTGSGCIFAYYGELHERILRDLGYEFEFLCFSRGRVSLDRAVETYRRLGGKKSPKELVGTLVFTLACLKVYDAFEYKVRENIGFETERGSFHRLRMDFMRDIAAINSLPPLFALKRRYDRLLHHVATDKPGDAARVGIVGELYTVMEPSANFDIERMLAHSGIAVSRRMSASYLLLPHTRKSMRDARGYLRHVPGATGADSVAQAVQYAKRGYDGVVHIKSCGCAPEVNVMQTLMDIGRDYDMPVLCMSYDTQTAEAGVQTRLEAFADMVHFRRTHIQ